MLKDEQNKPNLKRSSLVGKLLILAGITVVGVAVSISGVPVVGAPPSDVVATTQTPAPGPVRAFIPPLVEASPASTPVPEAQSTVTPDGTPPTSPAIAPQVDPPIAAAPHPVQVSKPDLPPATQIAIPSVGIDTSVVDVGYQVLTIEGQTVTQLEVADYAASHDAFSADPGEGGNIVISGHDDWKGEVFKNLHNAKLGDQVTLTTPQATHRYVITEIYYRKDVGVPLAERLAAGQFLAPMPEERLTLVTCWPYGIDTHRLIVVAKPL